MAETTVLSCPLCLRADEADTMVTFDIPHHAFLKSAHATICRNCCESIGQAIGAMIEAGEAAQPSESAPPAEPDSRGE